MEENVAEPVPQLILRLLFIEISQYFFDKELTAECFSSW
jgi:hypothetical protein